jgi:hypothetical protein
MTRPSQTEPNNGPNPRYELRNARKESWVDPTEDWPANLPFDTQLMAVRTQDELDAWIAAYKSQTIFQFFCYAKEQHDLEVTTHNEIVDMMDDATATVKGLEETLAQKNTMIALKNTTIERLQREIEGERTIKQNTPTDSEAAASKRSTKLSDPPIFESREQNIELWLSHIKNKLKANADHYPTDELKIAYTESRTGGEAALHITPRMRETALNRFETADEILDLLFQVYGDPDRRHTAQRAYLKLYQGKRSFAEFWAEF